MIFTAGLLAGVGAALAVGALAWVVVGYSGHWCATGAGRPSLARYAAALALEWWATLRSWVVYPLGLVKVRGFAAMAPRGGPPIALVHGFMMNRTLLFGVGHALRSSGHVNVFYIEPRPLRAPLEVQADMLAREVEKLAAHAGAPVSIVAHSQGGLVARVAMLRHPSLPVCGIVSIGSPHAGTVIAKRSRAPNGIQMRWGSPFLKALPPPALPYVSIYSDLDNIVFPKETARLGEAIELPGLGHHALCFSPVVMRHVLAALASFAPLAPVLSTTEA